MKEKKEKRRELPAIVRFKLKLKAWIRREGLLLQPAGGCYGPLQTPGSYLEPTRSLVMSVEASIIFLVGPSQNEPLPAHKDTALAR